MTRLAKSLVLVIFMLMAAIIVAGCSSAIAREVMVYQPAD